MSDVDALGSRIEEAIRQQGVARLAECYFNPEGPFAGTTFDKLGTRDDGRFTVDDLLAATTLDVRIRPLALRRILGEDAEELSRLLEPETLKADVALWEADDGVLDAAGVVWNRLRKYDGIDWVIAGKLMARKRPRLIPVLDSVIVRALKAPSGRVWHTMRDALSDADRRDRIEALRPEGLTPEVSTLRLLDVALWMLGSASRNAKHARAEVGATSWP